jgi:hypothetical protein
VTGPGPPRRAVLRCSLDGRRVTCPSPSLLDGLGRVRRVKGRQLRGGWERYWNPQASAGPCKWICLPDAARPAEVGKTTGMPGDGQPHVCCGGQRSMRPAGRLRRVSYGS